MDDIKISHQIKSQIRLFIGDRSKIQFDSGCKMFDVFIMDTFDFDKISFQNSYTCYLSIKAKDKKMSSENASSWKFLVRKLALMPSCHGESGSHRQFELTKDMFLNDTKGISQLRFILQQPSCYWKDFSIEDLKISIKNPETTLEHQLEKYSKYCENAKKNQIENIPPIEDLALKLQNLWSLCYEAKKQAKKATIERFDPNVCVTSEWLRFSPS